MEETILKADWERYKDPVELDINTASTLLAAYTDAPIKELKILSDGCANSNYKITFQNDREPVVIRIYVREQSALAREVGIHKLVHTVIPTPEYLYTDGTCKNFPHPYAIMQWIDGKLMRDVIFEKDEIAISECAYEAGTYLDILRRLQLPHGGFFQEDMTIKPFGPDEEYLTFVMTMLEHPVVQESLGRNALNDLQQLLSQVTDLFPGINDANLTHADYDPANMLVKNINGTWKITAILDWEFCYAGTYLLDIGLMLRYSHKLPECYEKSFIQGITDSGAPLPKDWKKQAKLMDLLCLLQLAHFNPPAERPYMNRDVVRLINHTVKKWNKF